VKKAQKKDPFDVTLTEQQETDLIHRLGDATEEAFSARNSIIGDGGDLDYYQWYYEQGQTSPKALRWPGAADLTSFLITESVDAMRARMVKTIFVEPFYIVEGWGQSADKAPFVEEFHQWKVEEERLQGWIAKVIHTSLIEGTGILEATERAEKRKQRSQEDVALQTDEQGSPMLDDKLELMLQRDETGDFVQQSGPGSASVVVDRWKTIKQGPQYRLVDLRDFVFLPGHARDESEVWGRVKRFYRRLPEIQARAKEGIYRNVDKLSEVSDRSGTQFEMRDGQQIAPQVGNAIEKELFEAQVLLDLDEDGIEEYYIVTYSIQHRQILRCVHDDIGLPRYLSFTPFPRSDSVYGYSYVQKLITLAEEHTALRNMIADRSALATNAPILRVQGALWDPTEQRFGVGAVIDVRDKNELTAMQIPDVPASVIQREQAILQAKERVSGQNDVALGSTPEVGRTLGEIQIRTEQSFVRMDEAIRNVQETMEDLGQIRHVLWVRALEADPAGGIEPPKGFIQSLALRDQTMPGDLITADQLKGTFRFKPRGSTDAADLNREQQNYNAWLQTMAHLAQLFPPVMALFSRPEAVRALIEQGLRVNRVRDRQAFLPPVGQVKTMLQPPMPGLGMPPGMPGAAPGLPPGLPPGMPALPVNGPAPTVQ